MQVQQLAIKILIDSGVGFKDSKGKNKAILTTPAIGVPSLETISEKLLGRQFSMALKTQL